MAAALDTWWDRLARPDPFMVVEAGAGPGTLARDVLAARPRCGPALRYVLVERSLALRRRQRDRLILEPARLALGPMTPDGPDDGPVPAGGGGPVVVSLPQLPAGPLSGVVLANELLDDLPFRLLERAGGRWWEVRVGTGGSPDVLAEVVVPAPPELAAEGERLAPGTADGGRIPVQHGAVTWLRQARALLRVGAVVVVDYADTTPSMARRDWRQWVRTYRGHGPGGGPLEDPGGQDVTCEVAVDQLARVGRPASDRSQADYLRAHGLDLLVEEARSAWQAGAARGDLQALRARSRVTEGEALTDPTGLGAFRVLEWDV
jgi:SAM-dependent MidA family methyltransferase